LRSRRQRDQDQYKAEEVRFALALLFSRIETAFIAVPDPQSNSGTNDRLNKAFPKLFREGGPGYGVNTW
jgi:hypothetical protein